MDWTGSLLKAGQGGQVPRVVDEEFYQTLRVVRYGRWVFFLIDLTRFLLKLGSVGPTKMDTAG